MGRILVMGLDLSLNGTGIAVIEVKGFEVKILKEEFVKNEHIKASERGKKLFNIYNRIEEVLESFEGEHIYIAKEKGFTKFVKATQALFEVSGVNELCLFCNRRKLDAEISPTTVKKLITGNGKASKEEVDKRLRYYLINAQKGYKFTSNDTSDAVAVAISYALQNKLL